MNERRITDDVMLMSFPWRTLGIDFRRNVTLLRLADGRVVVHSTAPFTEEDIAAIRRFGEPSWLVEATLLHDSFAKEGRAALPDLPYLAPECFAKATGMETEIFIVLHLRDWGRRNRYGATHRWSAGGTSTSCFTGGRARSWWLTCSFSFP